MRRFFLHSDTTGQRCLISPHRQASRDYKALLLLRVELLVPDKQPGQASSITQARRQRRVLVMR
jgi:hypothetical protein